MIWLMHVENVIKSQPENILGLNDSTVVTLVDNKCNDFVMRQQLCWVYLDVYIQKVLYSGAFYYAAKLHLLFIIGREHT